MCDRPHPCTECPDVLCCEDADKEEIPSRMAASALSPGGEADTMLLDTMTGRGLAFFEQWHASPDALKAAARRLVFDGGNPNDVLTLLEMLWGEKALRDEMQALPERTRTDPDAYMTGALTPANATRKALEGLMLSPERMFSNRLGFIHYEIGPHNELVYSVPQQGWVEGPATPPEHRTAVPARIWQQLKPALVAYFEGLM